MTKKECIKKILDNEKAKNKIVKAIVKNVEGRTPRALVELHEIVDNRYWVGYFRRGKDIIEELKKLLKEKKEGIGQMKIVITLLDENGKVTRQSDICVFTSQKAIEKYEEIRKNSKAFITKRTIHF